MYPPYTLSSWSSKLYELLLLLPADWPLELEDVEDAPKLLRREAACVSRTLESACQDKASAQIVYI